MKYRGSFVSNSSSSSFVIERKYLTQQQVEYIEHYWNYCNDFGVYDYTAYDGEIYDFEVWHINVFPDMVTGDVFMDNFRMNEYMQCIGVDMDKVEWGR